MGSQFLVGVLAVLALLAMFASGILAACDEAMGRFTRARALETVAEGQRHAQRIVWLADNWAATLIAIRSCAVLAHMAAAICVTLLVDYYMTFWWVTLLVTLPITFMLTYLLFRSSPRRWGREHPVKVVSLFSGLLLLVGKIAVWSGEITGANREVVVPVVKVDDEEEFEDLMDRASESGQIEEDERELLESVFEMGRTLVREVMVPRTDMVCIDACETLAEALSLFTRSGYSRVPVVGENNDDVLGIIYIKDVLRRTHRRRDVDGVTITDIMRPALFVPETRLVDDLLDDMRQQRVHIAMVVDEWGGIAGLVTIEDLLEELVGELEDEHDRQEIEPEEISTGWWRIPAKMPLDELGDLLDLDVDDDDVDTAGGLLTKALGKVPLAGSSATTQGIELAAERVEGRRKRIVTLLVRKVSVESLLKEVDDE